MNPADMLPAYFQLMNANGAAHVYREAMRCGLLDALGAGPKTADELAETCGIAHRPAVLMLQALAALGLTELSDSRFQPTPLAQLLLAGSYRNLGDEYWAHLSALLRTDQPLVKMDDPAQSEAHYQAQAAILGWMLTPAAECAARLLADRLPPKAAILDLGAGSGVWSLTIASQVPSATVTAVDWPAVLEVAAETAQNLGMADRLRTIAGNLHEIDLPAEQFDLTIIANVAHLLTPEANRALFRKAAGTLRSGGRLAVVDVFPGQPQGSLNVALYALGLALRTEHGRVHSPSELEPLLLDAGFDEPKLLPLPVPPFAVGMLLASRGPERS
jgi:SAM-dependent methyltransferase